jgi:predicted DNA-binding protein with PD1-like motif
MTISTNGIEVQQGTLGKMVMARLKPNQDITESIEELCLQNNIQTAIVRSAVGSLIDGNLTYACADGWRDMQVNGPGVEILNITGEVSFDDDAKQPSSRLQGIIADTDGRIFAGRLIKGSNLSFITIEVTLQEWIKQA